MNCRKLYLLFGVLPVTLLSAKTPYTHHVETSVATVAPTNTPRTTHTPSAGKHTLSTIILNRAREQLVYIDLALEEFAQAAANNKISLKNTQQVRAYITQLRELTTQARQYSTLILTPVHAQELVEFNALLLNKFSRALAHKFRSVPKINTDINLYLSRSPNSSGQTIDIARASDILLKNDDLLFQIPTQYMQLGVTPRQRFAKSTIKYLKKSRILAFGKRVLPYVGLGAYYIVINKEEALPDWGFVKKVKSILGKLPKSTTIHEVIPNTETNDHNREIRTQENTILNQDQQQPDQNAAAGVGLEQQEEHQEQYADSAVGDYASDRESAGPTELLEGLREELRTINTTLNRSTRDKSNVEKGTGVGVIFNKVGKLVGIETKPFYTIIPGALFLPIIKRDIQDLGKLASRAATYIAGDTPKSDALTKQSKITFNTIVGFEHVKQRLSNAISYFKHKKLFKRTGAPVDKSYLLVGSIDLGKQFAYAVAGEITKQYTTQNKNKRCGIYELHASALTSKKLTQVLKDLESETPCIVLLNELDWLVTHTADTTALWADIQAAYAQLEKKDLVIIATLESTRALDTLHNTLANTQSFGSTLELGLPTQDERYIFIQKELEKYAVPPTQNNNAQLAYKTAGCSYAQISRVLEKALSNAHVTRTTLTQEHVERSIDELIYGIVPSDTLSQQEKTMLSVYYAGKAIAYQSLYNDQSMIKVTLLPINKHNRQQQGALITTGDHNDSFTLTRSELEKQIIIELAGIQAQRLLLGHASRTLEEQAQSYAFAQAKTSILEGISEYDLPKKAREDFLNQAWDLTTHYSRQAQMLVETHKNTLQKIADKLATHKTLSAEQVNSLIN